MTHKKNSPKLILYFIFSISLVHDPQPNRKTDPGTRALRKSTHSHTPPHRLARTSEIRTVLEAYWLVRALVPISGSRRSHGGLGGRSEITTLNRPFCGVGALPLALWTAPHDNRARSSEASSSVSLNHQKSTVKTTLTHTLCLYMGARLSR